MCVSILAFIQPSAYRAPMLCNILYFLRPTTTLKDAKPQYSEEFILQSLKVQLSTPMGNLL